MNNEPLTIYKLIILYMLKKANSPLTPRIISDYILDKGYTNYFNIQKAFGELLDTDFIALDTTYKNSYYTLTELGAETLALFHNQLSKEIREEIVTYLKEHRYSIVEEIGRFTDYHRLPSGEYQATCSLKENGTPLLELNLSVATEAEAIKICNSFTEHNEEVYQYLIRTLL